MMHTFAEIIDEVQKGKPGRIAVAVAQDAAVLQAVYRAREMGITEAILVGEKATILSEAKKVDLDLQGFEIVSVENHIQAAKRAVELVRSGCASMLMKGRLETPDLLRAVLDKELGLRTGNLLSHVMLIEAEGYTRLFLMTDGAVVVAPDLKQKIEIIRNAAIVAHALGIVNPRVAPICAIELINPDMPATIDAAILTQMNRRGQLKGVTIDGPLALDNAVSMEAAKHKGIYGEVAGQADILLMPDIEAGNVFYKAVTYFGRTKTAGIVMGAAAPIILTSRADSMEAKLQSIATALLVSRFSSMTV